MIKQKQIYLNKIMVHLATGIAVEDKRKMVELFLVEELREQLKKRLNIDLDDGVICTAEDLNDVIDEVFGVEEK